MAPSVHREPIVIGFEEKSAFKETYGGGNMVVLEGQHLTSPGIARGKTVLIFMHPTGVMNHLPLPVALARAGTPVMTCGSRYPHNDTALIMEKVAIDLGAYVRFAKERLGYENVVLAGWSGGGSLSLFYQAEAEHPSIEATPAGDPVAMRGLIPADGVLQLAAHVSRAITLSEWIDPAVADERDPDHRNPEFDIYGDPPAEQPPFSAAFQEKYRAAQKARIRAITATVRERLAHLRAKGRPHDEHAFVVHGTMADLRWLDPTIDPNDRPPGTCYMGDPRVVNMSPAHLARYSSLRAWLSQWSELSRADGPACAGRVSVPALIIENSADDACTPSHAARIKAGFTKVTPAFHRIEGANHYYMGQKDKMAIAVTLIQEWLTRGGYV
jgi:pimeloyl-ACP methyl ester carboxylesterase